MNYEEALKRKKELNAINRQDSDNLNAFDDLHGGPNGNGLVPDDIREMPERKELKQKFDNSFRELRNFNQWFVKNYRSKRKAERKNRDVR